MKIQSLTIKNFRVFKNETIYFDDYTCFVGPNGVGKSTIINALKIFFKDSESFAGNVNFLSKQDFYHQNISDPIEITITFHDLNEQAKNDLSDYYRNNVLIVSAIAEYDENVNGAKVIQYGQRLVFEPFIRFFEAEKEGQKEAELKDIYKSIRKEFPDLPEKGRKSQMISFLREYENNHPAFLKPARSTDQFYGFTAGRNRLDRHIQWVHVPAVKDISQEQLESKNSAIGKLLERTVRAKVKFGDKVDNIRMAALTEYNDMLTKHMDLLDTLSLELENKIKEWAHPDVSLKLKWFGDPNSAIRISEPIAEVLTREGIFEGRLDRFGHGLQRSYLFALLHVLSGCEDADSPTLILGCEEPELYQHPPQLRHLYDVFHNLSKVNSQVILCTHSPLFVSGKCFENTRLLSKDIKEYNTTIKHAKYDEIAKLINRVSPNKKQISERAAYIKINQNLRPSLNELFFTSLPILVEGQEDLAYISTYMVLTGNWDLYRERKCHIIPTFGKHVLIEILAICKMLEMKYYVVFDSDANIEDQDKRKYHRNDNTAILKLCGYDGENPLPDSTLWKPNLTMWSSNIGNAVINELNGEPFDKIRNQVRQEYGAPGGIEKNTIYISEFLTRAWENDIKSESLKTLCENILTYAK